MLYQLSYTPRPGSDLCGEGQRRKGAALIDDFSKRPDHECGRPADEDESDQRFEGSYKAPLFVKSRAGGSKRRVGRRRIEKSFLHRPHSSNPAVESGEDEYLQKMKNESVAKKKIASRAVMMKTMMAVRTVSAHVGQTTFDASLRTCRMNSPGEDFATCTASSR